MESLKIFFRGLIWLAQLAVAVTLLVWLFKSQNLSGGMRTLLAEGDLRWVGIGIVLAGFSIAANIVRWRIFLNIQQIKVTWSRLVPIFLAGSFFNLFLPGVVGGEAVNALYLMRDNPGRKAAILLSIAADHLSGFLAITSAAAIFATARYSEFASSPLALNTFRIMWFVIGFGLFFIIVGFFFSSDLMRNRINRKFPKMQRFLHVAETFQLFMRHWKPSLLACGISFFITYAFFGTFYCAARAFGADLSLYDNYCVMPIVDVVSMIPVSISGLGVREVVMKELLAVLANVPADKAVLLSLTGFSFTVFWGLLGGICFPFLRFGSSAPKEDAV